MSVSGILLLLAILALWWLLSGHGAAGASGNGPLAPGDSAMISGEAVKLPPLPSLRPRRAGAGPVVR